MPPDTREMMNMEDRILPFEPRRFRTAAAHYLVGRPAYAASLIARVAQLTNLTQAHRVLDLGCGPGQLARAFSPYAADITGLDPEPEMLRIAQQNAPPNVKILEGSSYDLGPHLGSFHLVTIGRAFHWMDRADTLRRLDRLIAPGGAIALFSDSHPDVPDNDWNKIFREITDRYASGERFIRRGYGVAPTISILLDSAFTALETISVIERRPMTIGLLLERAFSRSTTSRERLADRAAAFAAEITDAMTALFPNGTFTEIVATQALIATRAP
jgi:SAM-dependent methyltransferase